MGCGVFLLAIEYASKIKGRPRIPLYLEKCEAVPYIDPVYRTTSEIVD